MRYGTILSGVGGFYEVQLDDGGLLTCRLRGKLRLSKQEGVLVGDRVGVLDSAPSEEGYIDEVLTRRSYLPRPAIANVQQVVAVMAYAAPPPNMLLLDRILVLSEFHGLTAAVCLNKEDLPNGQQSVLARMEQHAQAYPVFTVSAATHQGTETLKTLLKDKVTVLAGPSGVGKSTLINALVPDQKQQVGDISRKLGRGKHTTRQVKLLALPFGGFLADTPGFSQLSLTEIPARQLIQCFPDMDQFAEHCPYRGCTHTKEQICAVKEAVQNGSLPDTRYSSYLTFWDEIQQNRRY